MLQRFQSLERPQRILIFVLIFGGGLLLFVAIAAVLFFDALRSAPRTQAAALREGVTVREFATLPDDSAFPASVTVGVDGTIYTASYLTGTIWSIDPAGVVTELPTTRGALGAVSGITAAPNGDLYVVDRLSAVLGARGGAVMRVAPDGVISEVAAINDGRGFQIPDDITLDAQGNIYVSDWERDEVWRFAPDGSGQVFWTPPESASTDDNAPTGLAYDPVQDAIIITDPQVNVIYRVPTVGGPGEILYSHAGKPETEAPGFDGVTVTPDGVVYVAALGLNRVARLEAGELVYIAGDFRGASDVEYAPGRLYVTNWDQRWMLTDIIQARLPFALDVIELQADTP